MFNYRITNNPMSRIMSSALVLVMGFLFFIPVRLHADNESVGIKAKSAVRSDNPAAKLETALSDTTIALDSIRPQRESIFNTKTRSLAFSHFVWGAETGASLDLTSHDMSTFDVDVLFGYKNSCIKVAGIGAGIHRSVHIGNNLIPVYAVFRSSFRSKPSLLFLNVQAGYSFNSFGKGKSVGDFMGALGVGINLQQTRVAKSYIVLSAAYQYFNDTNREKIDIDTHYIFFARLMFGVNF